MATLSTDQDSYTLSTPTNTNTGNATTPTIADSTFTFPPHHSFPPFYTLQPNLTTQLRQLYLWSTLIQSYCHHHLVHKLSISTISTSPLFSNPKIHRSLDLLSIRRVLDFMATHEGDLRTEWIGGGVAAKGQVQEKNNCWVWWRRPEEWAERIYGWVDETGQKGLVLTIYELRESDAVANMEWVTMDEEQLRKCLEVLVKKGKAQVFGQQDGAGVKFF